MEAHAHHLHKTPGHGWKHYFFEFFMLFLAVTLGFLVENRREHYVERQRGKEYVRSFCKDLSMYTAEFTFLIDRYQIQIKALEKRRECYDSIKKNFKSAECLNYLFNYSITFPDFINSDQTLLQLKNAGGLRLLEPEDADSILRYDKETRSYLKGETTEFQETQTNIRAVINSLWNYDYTPGSKKQPKPGVLLSENPELVNRYFNLLEEYYEVCLSNIDAFYDLRQRATGFIGYFKKKYHFK
jgi:hypothetical protein